MDLTVHDKTYYVGIMNFTHKRECHYLMIEFDVDLLRKQEVTSYTI